MKLVKKFLRLMPIIILFVSFIFYIFSANQQYGYIYENDGVSSIEQFYRSFQAVLNDYGQPIFSVFDLNSNIIGIFEDYFMIETSVFVPLDLVLSILTYELFLSIVFLFFDLFNWFLSLGRNLLKKGGKYDD